MKNISKNWIFIIVFNILTIIEYILMNANSFFYILSIQIALLSIAVCKNKINLIFILTAIFLFGFGIFLNIAIYKNLFAHIPMEQIWNSYKWLLFISGIAFLCMIVFGTIGLLSQHSLLSIESIDFWWMGAYFIIYTLFSSFISTSYLALNLAKNDSKYIWNIFSYLIMFIISNGLLHVIYKTSEILKRKFNI